MPLNIGTTQYSKGFMYNEEACKFLETLVLDITERYEKFKNFGIPYLPEMTYMDARKVLEEFIRSREVNAKEFEEKGFLIKDDEYIKVSNALELAIMALKEMEEV